MFIEKRNAHRYTFIRPVAGQTLIMGQSLEISCELIDVSSGGARIELLPPPDLMEETCALLHALEAETVSMFPQVYLGPWKIDLLIKGVAPIEKGYCIGGAYAKTPIVPIQALSDLLSRHEAFYCYAKDDRFVIEGDVTPEAIRQASIALNERISVLDLTNACILPDTRQMIESIRANGVSVWLKD